MAATKTPSKRPTARIVPGSPAARAVETYLVKSNFRTKAGDLIPGDTVELTAAEAAQAVEVGALELVESKKDS